jgi:hypothetical protein
LPTRFEENWGPDPNTNQANTRSDEGTMNLSKSRRMDGMYLVLLGSAVFLLLGFALEYAAPHPVSDFRFVYNGVRCLLQNADPYQRSEFLRVYLADGGDIGVEPFRSHYMEMARHMYPPTSAWAFPLALLHWDLALALWSILIAATFIVAAMSMWNAGAEHAPVLSGFLLGGILATSELLLVTGNAAGIVVSLCAIAAWCFVQDRFATAGIICLTTALMLKPHDAGFVWLFFLLAGGVYRKRALQTLAATVAATVPVVLWVTLVAPKWLPELHSNLAALSAHGGLNDPGPDSLAGHGLAMVVDLQSVFSVFRDDPHFYNLASYGICGILILVWAVVTMRFRPSRSNTWFALAAISALSMLPVYHRLGDTKLLVLTVPACAILWAEGGIVAWLAVSINGLALVLTGDLQWAAFLAILNWIPTPANSEFARMAMQVFPVPLILLAVGIFYLWIYMRRMPVQQALRNEPPVE